MLQGPGRAIGSAMTNSPKSGGDLQKPDRCPCGGIMLADTEDWQVPLCHSCWNDIGEPSFEPKHDRTLLALAERSEKMWRALAAYDSLKQQALAMREALAEMSESVVNNDIPDFGQRQKAYADWLKESATQALEQFDEFMRGVK